MAAMIIGVDEVGRGCWAGPLVAGAVMLQHPIDDLRDSKRLSARQRQVLAEQIDATAFVGIGWVSPQELDTIGLTEAVRLAMERAVAQLPEDYETIIVDGNYNFLEHLPRTEALIKADDTVPAVSAASIMAKVARDTYMATLPTRYDGYMFAKHVGYGTAAHVAALHELGVSDLHRRSFKPIKALLQ